MTKHTVEYDKEGCIGAFSCVAVFPKYWDIGQDGKAILINGKEKDGKFYIEIDESELKAMKDSAESCPVNVIHIYDEKGNKIL